LVGGAGLAPPYNIKNIGHLCTSTKQGDHDAKTSSDAHSFSRGRR
jgi:hypothetical protein